MSQGETVSLHEWRPADAAGDQARSGDPEQETSGPNNQDDDSRLSRSNRERALVLVGSALLQLPIWGINYSFFTFLLYIIKWDILVYCTDTDYSFRFRHDLRRLSRILFQQLDAKRKPLRHRYHRYDLQRRHVPLNAVPLRTLHPPLGPETTSGSAVRDGVDVRQFLAVIFQHRSLAFSGDARGIGAVGMCAHLQPNDAIARRVV